MSNPFKVGDKVMRLWPSSRDVMTVTRVTPTNVWTDNCEYPEFPWPADGTLRAAIAGQDYDVPAQPNTGHLPDGSSVQKHSAGPIYPCVITLRDKRLKGTSLFDYGITSPRNPEPFWLSTLEAAHAVADIINKDIAQ